MAAENTGRGSLFARHERSGRVAYRLFDPPFISYVYLGPVGLEWGDGLVVRAWRLYVHFKARWLRRSR